VRSRRHGLERQRQADGHECVTHVGHKSAEKSERHAEVHVEGARRLVVQRDAPQLPQSAKLTT
jgi:hypothetical protein